MSGVFKTRYETGVVEFGNGSFAWLQPDGSWGLSNSGLVADRGETLLVDTLFDLAHTQEMLDGYAGAVPAATFDRNAEVKSGVVCVGI